MSKQEIGIWRNEAQKHNVVKDTLGEDSEAEVNMEIGM